ncbi:MAG: hypothetical protein WCT08_00220 [Patescibacteria group bacterium]|jgi:hypothetical protein
MFSLFNPYLTLGYFWARKGLLGIPKEMHPILQKALLIEAPRQSLPEPKQVNVQDEFLIKIREWEGLGVKPNWEALQDLSRLRLFPAFRMLTLDTIEFNCFEPNEVRVSESLRNSGIWKWKYYHFAFAIYWALMYHVLNERLAQPEKILAETLDLGLDLAVRPDLAQQIGSLVVETSGINNNSKWALELALYERTLGFEVDITQKRPHYIANIEQRDGLSTAEQDRRIQLFADLVKYLKAELEKLLLAHQKK